MAIYTKVPSQAASGADSFSDYLVGFQITDGSSQMTAASFAIDKVIPEKDSKIFITQPFSDFLTLNDLNQETDAVTTQVPGTPTTNIKFLSDKDDGARSLFGSLDRKSVV